MAVRKVPVEGFSVIGKSISHYLIIEKLGQGGMGEVFLAQDTSLDRNVAIKFLPPEMRNDPVARERFLRGPNLSPL
jgi:serine/threonine protein kinase